MSSREVAKLYSDKVNVNQIVLVPNVAQSKASADDKKNKKENCVLVSFTFSILSVLYKQLKKESFFFSLFMEN